MSLPVRSINEHSTSTSCSTPRTLENTFLSLPVQSIDEPGTSTSCSTPKGLENISRPCCQNSGIISVQIGLLVYLYFCLLYIIYSWKCKVNLYSAGKLISIVAHVKEQNQEILAWIQNQAKVNVSSTLPNLPVICPIKTLEELNELDNHLKLHKSDYEALVILW